MIPTFSPGLAPLMLGVLAVGIIVDNWNASA